ncbi:MAG: glycoside hydrolase family 127 protein [Clostridia bacterium]|nr:glycoside hydrolase family 127 protein [Clostridia bacterium]
MYRYVNPNEFYPEGWLLSQLQLQAKGLWGNLDKMWPDVRDSAWIGGAKDGWERVPYWLDGFIPLAYLLRDEDLKARAQKYIDAILDRQEEDGWICPCSYEERESYDPWAFFLMGKVLSLYLSFKEDKRVEEGLYKAMKCLYIWVKDEKLRVRDWGNFRTFECLIPLLDLYSRYPEEWIIELARLLKIKGADYYSFRELYRRPMNRWRKETHIVNLCMMFKSDALYNALTGENTPDHAEELWQILEKYNGTAVGTFTGDECLAGIGNNHGTELCAVVELMYTCEVLFSLTGDRVWLDRLEKAAFNALPATVSDDMWSHQYDQQVNQIACIPFPGKSFFRTNGQSAHLFGLEPEFGCCTANGGQGWPKLAMSVYARKDKEIIATMMLSGRLETTVEGKKVNIRCESGYPFVLSGRYTVTSEEENAFTFKIRVPAFAKGVKVNGKSAPALEGYLVFDRIPAGETTIEVAFEDTPRFVRRPFDLYTAEYGPLVFSMPIKTEYLMKEYEKEGVVRKHPYCDYHLIPKSDWQFAFADVKLSAEIGKGDEIPFSEKNPRVMLKASLVPIDWGYADGYETVASDRPASRRALGDAVAATLVPYGGAKLRMTEMPFSEN